MRGNFHFNTLERRRVPVDRRRDNFQREIALRQRYHHAGDGIVEQRFSNHHLPHRRINRRRVNQRLIAAQQTLEDGIAI